MAARRRGIGSRVGAPNRPDFMSRIWAMARIVPGAVNDSVRQTIFPVRPQAYHTDWGRQATLRGFHFEYPRNGAHKNKSLGPYSGSTEGTRTSGLEPAVEPGAGVAQSCPGHLAR